MSIGVGSKRFDDPSCADQLVAAADAALYQAKAAGRDQIVISRAAAGVVAPA
jgi:PleD family two-component response regulator